MNLQDMAVVNARLEALDARYSDPRACVAELLCDQHDTKSLAYRIVEPDLSFRDMTYGELAEESRRFAAGLAKLGVGSGDRVAAIMGKGRDYLVSLLAIWRVGAVYVPLFTAFAPAAIAMRLTASDAKFVICDSTQRPKLSPGEDMPADARWGIICTGDGVVANDVAFADVLASEPMKAPPAAMGSDQPLIHIFTSGTTGRPKGVIVPIRALADFHAYAEFGLDLRENDLYWCAADPGWAYGLYLGVAHRVRRSENDDRAPRPHHPSLRHRRDRQ